MKKIQKCDLLYRVIAFWVNDINVSFWVNVKRVWMKKIIDSFSKLFSPSAWINNFSEMFLSGVIALDFNRYDCFVQFRGDNIQKSSREFLDCFGWSCERSLATKWGMKLWCIKVFEITEHLVNRIGPQSMLIAAMTRLRSETQQLSTIRTDEMRSGSKVV